MSATVLLADDEPLVRTGLRLILEGAPDIEVVGEAATGKQAAASARRLRPDVVLMDLRMPIQDGLQATREIKQMAELDCGVVILTSFERDDFALEALRAGASGYVLKSAPPQTLVHAVRAIAEGQALIAPLTAKRTVEQPMPIAAGGLSC